jgi:hypothetical protein
MPDVQEVFRLATQKVRPDPGALDRQLVNQRRSIRRRRLGVYALVGVLATAALIVALAYRWTLSDRRPDTDDGACLQIGGENVCYHIDRETPFFVECLAQGGGYLLAASGLEVDRTWIDVEGAGTIEGRWMPFRSPEEEMRAWLLFLPGTGNGTLRIGRSFEQPVSWAPCGD